MKYISKFNELVETKLLSNDRIDEILKELETLSGELDKNISKYQSLVDEISDFTSKSKKANTQIDDTFLGLKDLLSKMQESSSLIVDITEKLESHKKEGEKFLD